MKVAFAGTPEFAATVLRGLDGSTHEIGLVVSQPDPRRGRGRRRTPNPVSVLARNRKLPLLQPARISDVAAEISENDALVVAAYGQILRADTLRAAPHGAWNVHASLLPRYRGAAPVERAIMEGEKRTGVSIVQMDEGLDTGPVALQRSVPIAADTTGGELTDTLAGVGADAVVEVLNLLERGGLTLTAQDSRFATYASKLLDDDKVIRWGWGAGAVHDLVRALAPGIGARAFHPDGGRPVKIWRSAVWDRGRSGTTPGRIRLTNRRLLVECGVGVLEVLELQVPGGRRVRATDFLLGRRLEGAFEA